VTPRSPDERSEIRDHARGNIPDVASGFANAPSPRFIQVSRCAQGRAIVSFWYSLASAFFGIGSGIFWFWAAWLQFNVEFGGTIREMTRQERQEFGPDFDPPEAWEKRVPFNAARLNAIAAMLAGFASVAAAMAMFSSLYEGK
jgi:hypothetical protein